MEFLQKTLVEEQSLETLKDKEGINWIRQSKGQTQQKSPGE